jgi:replicative DNA helicase
MGPDPVPISAEGASPSAPPQSLEAEQSILGAILEDNEAFYTVASTLKPEHFYGSAHRAVFETMIEITDDDVRIDLILLKERLAQKGILEKIGGEATLAGFLGDAYSVPNIEYYADIVIEKAFLRNLAQTCIGIHSGIAQTGRSPREIRDWGEQQLFDAFKKFERKEVSSIKDLLTETMDNIEAKHTGKHLGIGVETGFDDLDDLTNGLQPSQLIIIAARPSMGKTSFALNIATNVAVRQRKGVLFFSVETDKMQVTKNILCAHARVDSQKVNKGIFDRTVWDRLVDAAGYISSAPIFIDDTASLSLLMAKTRARLLKAREDIKLVIVDYLQLMEGRQRRVDSREQEISYISRGLKHMARELEVPVIALAQLNRSVERRDDHNPRLHDLRESGAIEQDADIIAFLHRPGYYQKASEDNPVDMRKTELIIAKHRNGPTRTLALTFMMEYLRFEKASSRDADGYGP